MNSIKLISTGRITALISFIGGTIIILLFYLTSSIGNGLLGLGYVLIAGIFNLAVLSIIIYKSKIDRTNRKGLFKIGGLMLLNIPVLFIYCWLAIILMNTVRITFVNSTSEQLDNIKIDGCHESYINKLPIGQSKTVWIAIPNDCSVSVTYKINGQSKIEDVTGYVTNEGGYKMTFKIGTNQKPYDRDL